MKKIIIIMSVIMVFLVGCNSEKPSSQIAKGSEVYISKDSIKSFVMTKENEKQLIEFRKQFVQTKACPGDFPVPIAVSATGYWKRSSGAPTLLNYHCCPR